MELAARPYAVATAALVAGGLMAAAPVVATLPGVQLRDVALTTGFSLGDIADAQLGANSDLFNSFLKFNGVPELTTKIDGVTTVTQEATGLNGFETDLIEKIKDGLTTAGVENLKGDPINTYVFGHGLNQLFDANNAALGMNQAALLGLLGVRGTVDSDGNFTSTDLAGLNSSLIVNPGGQADALGEYAGLESMIGHYIGALGFLNVAITGANGHDFETGPAGAAFDKLIAAVTTFNTQLVEAEHGFNDALTGDQVALEEAIFGNDSALNGIVNRSFNSFNMLFDAQQQSLNGFLGVTDYDPQELTSSLLQGSAAQTFNDGSIGGLMGMFSQNLALLTDIAGLKGSDFTGLFDNFNADAFSEASKSLFETLAGGPFGDVFGAGGAFSDLLTELGNAFTTLG